MEKELWLKCQDMINKGTPELITHILFDYLKSELSENELKPLGDVEGFLVKVFKEDPTLDPKHVMQFLISLSKKGYIISQKPMP